MFINRLHDDVILDLEKVTQCSRNFFVNPCSDLYLKTAAPRALVCKIYLSPPRPSLLSILIYDCVVVH